MTLRNDRIAKRGGGVGNLARAASALQRLLVAALAWGFGLPGALAQSGPDFGEAAKGVVKALDLQTSFPNPAVASEPEPWLHAGDSVRFLLWVAVAVGAVVIALYLRDILPGGGLARRKKWNAGDSDLQPGTSAEAEAQINADELARLGRFVDAMHVLLLQALADMHRRLDVAIADSLTSREILRRAKVSPLAKSALQ